MNGEGMPSPSSVYVSSIKRRMSSKERKRPVVPETIHAPAVRCRSAITTSVCTPIRRALPRITVIGLLSREHPGKIVCGLSYQGKKGIFIFIELLRINMNVPFSALPFSAPLFRPSPFPPALQSPKLKRVLPGWSPK